MRMTQQTVALVQHYSDSPINGIVDESTQRCLKARFDVDYINQSVLDRVGIELDSRGDPDWFRMLAHGGVEIGLPGVSGSFVPRGVIIHHSAGPVGRDITAAEVRKIFGAGRPDLHGPLANVVVARDGTPFFVTNGRAHHAGPGDSRVLRDVMMDGLRQPPIQDDDYGNSHFFGIEIDNSGKTGDTYPAVQLETAASIAAQWCYWFGWRPATRVIGHKEWTRRKVDPSFEMEGFVSHVQSKFDELVKNEGEEDEDLVARIEALEARLKALEAKA